MNAFLDAISQLIHLFFALINLAWVHRVEIAGVLGTTTIASVAMQKVKKWIGLEKPSVKVVLSYLLATATALIPVAITAVQTHTDQLGKAGIHVGFALATLQLVYTFVKWVGKIMDDVKAGRTGAPVEIAAPAVTVTTVDDQVVAKPADPAVPADPGTFTA